MNPQLEILFNQLSESKRALEMAIAAASCDAHFATVGEWSIAQVVEHLVSSESGTLGYMKKKCSSGWESLEEAGDEHRANSAAINARLESNERYKAPDVLPEPTNDIDLQELFSRWNLLREEMKLFLAHVPSEHLNKLVFRQPAAGMLNTVHALKFMDAHLRHHLPQIERISNS